MNRFFGAVLGASSICLELLTAAPVLANESTTIQINPQHSGSAQFQPPLKTPLKQVWTRDLGGMTTYPLIAQGLVFVDAALPSLAYGSTLYALNKATGATVWSQSLSGTYFTSAISYDEGTVFAVNYDGLLRAFDAATGVQKWQVQLPNQSLFDAAPNAHNGVVYVNGSGSGVTLYAVRESDGVVLWSQSMQAGNWSSPTLSEDGVFASYPCHVYSFDAITGASRWATNAGCDGGGGVTAALYDQMLFTSGLSTANYAAGVGLRAFDGVLVGGVGGVSNTNAYQRGVGMSYPPALQGGLGYFIDSTNRLMARKIPTRSWLWTFGGDGTISPAPIVVDGVVLAASLNGKLYALNGQTGAVLQTLTLPSSTAQGIGGVPNALAAGENVVVVPYDTTVTLYAPN